MVVSRLPSGAAPSLAARAYGGLRRTRLLPVVALFAVVLVAILPQQVVQDFWLALVSGREVVRHGLPGHDHLTVMAAGARWVDQQWLAQILFYRLASVGGVKLALLVNAVVLVSAFALALAAARRLGCSVAAVWLVALPTMFIAPWALQMRAQTLAELLFVVLLWLLAADSRKPSLRVLWFVPLLCLWANVHGTVVLGALLVVLRGVTILVQERDPAHRHPHRHLRAVTLLAAPLPCTLASPYGLALIGYYRTMLLNSKLSHFVQEWGVSSPGFRTALFYLIGAATVWTLARHGARLPLFGRLVLAVTLVSGVWAVRSIIWFGLACLVLLPAAADGLLDDLCTRVRASRLRANVDRLAGQAALGAAVVVAGAALVAAVQGPARYLATWHAGAVDAVAAATVDPSTRVFADDRYADWLLWRLPSLRGRVAYDVRFEPLDAAQLERLFEYRNRIGDGWRRAARGYQVLVFDPSTERDLWTAATGERGARVLYADSRIGVVRESRT